VRFGRVTGPPVWTLKVEPGGHVPQQRSHLFLIPFHNTATD
jgi:hypothetical protein